MSIPRPNPNPCWISPCRFDHAPKDPTQRYRFAGIREIAYNASDGGPGWDFPEDLIETLGPILADIRAKDIT